MFADEMTEVFTSALDDAARQGRGALLRFCLREFGALSFSVVREQMAAYRARRLVPAQEGVFMQSPGTISYRFYVTAILILIAAFCVLIVLPFFGHIIPYQTVGIAVGGAPGAPHYIESHLEVGGWMRLLGTAAIVATPLGVVAFGLRLAYFALRDWRRLTTERHRLVLITIAIVVGMIAFLLSDVGRFLVSLYLG